MSALKAQVLHYPLTLEAEGTKNNIALRAGSGTPVAAFMHRSGNKNGVPGQYGNVNWSDGFWDGDNLKQASWTFMSDYEDTGRTKARRAHTLLGSAIRTQRSTGVSNRDIDQIYNFTAASPDVLEINNLEIFANDDCESLVVPITGGIADQDIGEVQLPVGVGTVNIPLTFVANLLYIGTVSDPTAPSVQDAKTDGGGGDQRAYIDHSDWCTGVAWNNGSNVQRCMAMEEVDTKNLVSPPHPTACAFVVRNDAVATKISGGATVFSVSVTDWEAGGGTEIELTTTAGANGEWLVFHGLKFDNPTKVALVDTTLPNTSGDWEQTGLTGKPQLVISRNVMNAAAYNTVYQDDYSLNTIIFDEFDCFTSTVTAPYNENPIDGSGNARVDNNVTCYAEFTGGVDTIEAQYGQPTMTNDGWLASQVVSPTADFLGFAVVFFEDLEFTSPFINKPGFLNDAGVIKPYQGGTFPGELIITAHKTSGVSPCGIVFTAKDTTRNGYDSHQVLGIHDTQQIGYHFDFGDPTSGNFNTFHGTSKNKSLGGFMATHVFEVADGGGTKNFKVACRAKDSAGNEALAFINVTVQARDTAFTGANTIAVSNTEPAGNWDTAGYDRVPQAGYTERATLAGVDVANYFNNIQGKLILLKRGDDFSAEGIYSIRSGNDNFAIGWWGDELSGTVVNEGASTISFAAPASGKQLAFDGGTTAFVAGETVTGGTSTHEGVIRTIVVNTGDWGTNNAAGTMDIDSPTGIFLDNEPLSGSATGVAVAKGTTTDTEIDKNSGIGGTITDTNNGLGALTVSAEIDITGAAGNNSTWTIKSVAAGEITVSYNSGVVMTTEAANGNAVITEHNLYPYIKELRVGTKQANSADVITLDDGELAANAAAFGNEGWIENAQFEGLRAGYINNSISYKNLTYHKIDSDFYDAPATGIAGGIKLGNAQYAPWEANLVDPNSIPFMRGLVLSDSTFIGSFAQVVTNGDPGLSISAVSLRSIVWFGLVGCKTRTSREHNFRLQGYQNFVAHECEFLGQHIGGSGSKGRFAVRGAGLNHRGEITELTRKGDYAADDTDQSLLPASQWHVGQYIFDSGASIGASVFSTIETSSTVETSLSQLHEDSLWTHYTIDPTSTQLVIGSIKSVQIQVENVRWCLVSGVDGLQNSGISEGNADSIVDNGPDNVVTDGVKTTQANYLGPNYLATTASPDLYNLPVPTAPR